MLPGTLEQLLAAGGVAIVFGFLKSYLIENIPAFQALPAEGKRVVLTIAGVVLAVLAFAISTYVPGSVIESLNPLYAAILIGIEMASTEAAHQRIN